ncbi:hypothetical protein EJ04DRAFT_563887 [Polyplosphaeria fusca]|uniref:Uncharacterized protein n=1 Tax=Polyplosphaeria fusca TaxID=682080 RepID=A0A9P4V040_9PLEO|nr:hypothetical protein EJ04DRAFT_563887 [Polyplosphaeria fusca]
MRQQKLYGGPYTSMSTAIANIKAQILVVMPNVKWAKKTMFTFPEKQRARETMFELVSMLRQEGRITIESNNRNTSGALEPTPNAAFTAPPSQIAGSIRPTEPSVAPPVAPGPFNASLVAPSTAPQAAAISAPLDVPPTARRAAFESSVAYSAIRSHELARTSQVVDNLRDSLGDTRAGYFAMNDEAARRATARLQGSQSTKSTVGDWALVDQEEPNVEEDDGDVAPRYARKQRRGNVSMHRTSVDDDAHEESDKPLSPKHSTQPTRRNAVEVLIKRRNEEFYQEPEETACLIVRFEL